MERFLKVKDISEITGKCEKWVYTHFKDLGGFMIGGSIFFTMEGLSDAIQRRQQMEGVGKGRRDKVNPDVRQKRRGVRVGKVRAQEVERDRIETGRRFGLVDVL